MPATYPYSRRPCHPPLCRSPRCAFPRAGTLGFCTHCEAIYRAALVLRASRVDAYAARLRAAHPRLYRDLPPRERRSLLAHLAVYGLERGHGDFDLELRALEDFLAELNRVQVGE